MRGEPGWSPSVSWWRARSPAPCARTQTWSDPTTLSVEAAIGDVEVEGVGQVELGLDESGAVEGDLLVVERHVPAFGCVCGVLQGLVGHEPGDGLLDQPVELRGTDLVGEGRQLDVHVPGGFLGEAQSRGRHPAGPPRLERPGLNADPVAWKAVLQLHRVCDHGTPGVGGPADGQRELGNAEPRHQRSALAREGQLGLSAGARATSQRRRSTPAVLLGPGHGREHHVGLGPVGRDLAIPGEIEHRGCGVEVGPGGRHTMNSSSDH